MRRLPMCTIMGSGLLAGALLLGTPVLASAATTGYPGTTTPTTAPTSTTAPASGTVVPNGGSITIPVGTTVTVSVPGFAPGSTVHFTVNGVAESFTVTAGSNGDSVVTISVTDPHISLNGTTPVVANVGANTVSGTGTDPTGAATTKSFTITIPATAATAATTSTSSSGLAFTGADIAITVVGGLALLTAGTVLVVATRRRSGNRLA